ncbi:hypothetical protein KIN20_020420 [Parelaphostrongylus tenuis]|uniref:Uncharacterized protein n=1 Tax=Parelaphostrongylus tenuis TaxID=148309 RepID=A0AAD5N374_PARTN|nr:hypothetical protein KIN20_020420 [Parelaphostrongylus tenuis]
MVDRYASHLQVSLLLTKTSQIAIVLCGIVDGLFSKEVTTLAKGLKTVRIDWDVTEEEAVECSENHMRKSGDGDAMK